MDSWLNDPGPLQKVNGINGAAYRRNAPNQVRCPSGSTPLRSQTDSNWSCKIPVIPKYFDSGWAKYQPETEEAGVIAKLSVNDTPKRSVALSKEKIPSFS